MAGPWDQQKSTHRGLKGKRVSPLGGSGHTGAFPPTPPWMVQTRPPVSVQDSPAKAKYMGFTPMRNHMVASSQEALLSRGHKVTTEMT